MNQLRNSLVPGQIPAVSQMNPGDIAVNNADGILYILKQNGTVQSIVEIAGLTSFNDRVGAITLESSDVTTALGFTPIGTNSPAFTGTPTAPTATAGSDSTQLATTAFVQNAINAIVLPQQINMLANLNDVSVSEGPAISGNVLSFNATLGKWTALQLATVATSGSYTDLSNKPSLSTVASSGSYTDLLNTPAPYTLPIASISTLGGVKAGNGVTISTSGVISANIISTLAGLSDVSVTESPTINNDALVYNSANSKWQATGLSAVAFSGNYSDLAGVPASGGVTAFNTRTGAITLESTDITSAGGALLASPVFTGVPAAPTASAGTNTTQLATTAFVTSAVSSATSSLSSTYASTASPAFTGTPTAPTATAGTDTTQIATTAFVTNAISASTPNLSGYAPLASPTFTGVPAAPTASAGTNTTQIATTAFVTAAIATVTSNEVVSFNTRTGAVTLQAADVTGVGGALLASPAFTGTPTAPTALAGTNTSQIATTAFVTSAITASAGVTTFNTRSGAITLTSGDITSAGGALLASPTFTGTPAAPTAATGTSTTQLATTAFVAAAKYYDVSGGAVGAIVASQLMSQFVSGRTVTFPAGLTNSQGYALTAPTGAVSLTIAVNGTTVGTIAFAAGSHTATFTASSAFTVTPGQLITVTAPASADATLATVSFTLLGLAT
jgi:hypothetical protein